MEDASSKIDICPSCGSDLHFRFANKNGYDIWQCENCGMRRVYPLPETIDVYDDDYFSGAKEGFGYVDYDAGKEAMRDVLIKYLNIIKDHTSGRRLLDVGGATGYFANLARMHGFEARAIELSKEAVALGKTRGYPVEVGILSNVNLEPGSLDVVTLVDVLEHLPDPSSDIRIANRLLNDGGVLLLNFPDHGSVFARALGRWWHQYVPPEHLNFFHKGSIEIFLNRHDFEPVLITRIGKRFPLSYIQSVGSNWLGVPVIDRVTRQIHKFPKLAKIAIPLDLRDNLFVIAKKRGKKK